MPRSQSRWQTDEAPNLPCHDCSLRVHVPKWYMLWPQCNYIGTTLRPQYTRFGHADLLGVGSRLQLLEICHLGFGFTAHIRSMVICLYTVPPPLPNLSSDCRSSHLEQDCLGCGFWDSTLRCDRISTSPMAMHLCCLWLCARQANWAS